MLDDMLKKALTMPCQPFIAADLVDNWAFIPLYGKGSRISIGKQLRRYLEAMNFVVAEKDSLGRQTYKRCR